MYLGWPRSTGKYQPDQNYCFVYMHVPWVWTNPGSVWKQEEDPEHVTGKAEQGSRQGLTHHRHCSSPRGVDESGQESWAKTGPGSGVVWWEPVSVVNSSECSFAFTSLKAPWTLCGSKSFPKIFTCRYSMFRANFSTRVVTECAMCLGTTLGLMPPPSKVGTAQIWDHDSTQLKCPCSWKRGVQII